MSQLPVIVGFGGINPAGRSSGFNGYRRLVLDNLPTDTAQQTLCNLAVLRGMIRHTHTGWQTAEGDAIELDNWLQQQRQSILDGSLIRQLDSSQFDPANLPQHQRAVLSGLSGDDLLFTLPTRNLPNRIPDNWVLDTDDSGRMTTVRVHGELPVMLPDTHATPVNTAGQLPSGFRPDALYPSRSHPRGLQMAIYGISDALQSMGIDWSRVMDSVDPDQISVYAGSSMSQLDQHGNGGMLQARLLGRKVMSKQLPLGFAEMPADFINAYVIGNLGGTGANLGACATFHYNLAMGMRDIRNGTHRVVIVGGSEAPIVPEIIEGFANMGALADDEKLKALDAHLNLPGPDHRRACRPFGENVGFTLGESAQFVVLFDDALALELGANIHGAVNDVFVSADGYKKSIASPGVGNYLTFAKAAAATRAIIGEEGLRRRSYIQAHGTGTPQNRVTESAIFEQIAREFGITDWPIAAVKAYVGHSLCCSGADQLMASLGVWQDGIIPGITTTEALAEDVRREGLDYLLQHRAVDPGELDAVLINSKGFGGNNATASILSPAVTHRMLEKKHGRQAMTGHGHRNERVSTHSADYSERTCREDVPPIYLFDHNVRDGEHIALSERQLHVTGYTRGINLDLPTAYPDMDIQTTPEGHDNRSGNH